MVTEQQLMLMSSEAEQKKVIININYEIMASDLNKAIGGVMESEEKMEKRKIGEVATVTEEKGKVATERKGEVATVTEEIGDYSLCILFYFPTFSFPFSMSFQPIASISAILFEVSTVNRDFAFFVFERT